MALQKQQINVSFAQGVDTKSDPKQVIMGKLLALENGTFISPGRVKKRPGYEKLAAISDANALASFKDEVLAMSDTRVYSLDRGTSTIIEKGHIAFSDVQLESVVANANTQTCQDMSLNPLGLKTYVYEDSSGGSRYTVTDTSTNNQLVSNGLVGSTAVCPKTVVLNNITYIFYIDTGDNSLKYVFLTAASPTTLSTPASVTAVKTTNQVFDLVVQAPRIYIAFVSAGGKVAVTYVNSAMSSPLTPTTSTDDVAGPITIFCDSPLNKLWVVYATSTKVRYINLNTNIQVTTSPTDIQTISNVVRITGCATSNAGAIYYEVSAAKSYNHVIRQALITSGTVAASSEYRRSVGLGAKCYQRGSEIFVVAIYDSGLGAQLSTVSGAPQNKYFLIDISGRAVGKLLGEPNTAGALPAKDTLPSVNTLDGVNYFIAVLINRSTTGYAFQLNQAVSEIQLNYNTKSTKVELGDNLHIAAGALLFMYDGANVVEHGFNLYPEPLSAASTNNGGSLSAGAYQYVTTYEWLDNQGQLHRSAPSVPTSIDLTSVSGSPVSFTATFSTGDTTLTVSSTSGLFVGQTLTDVTTGGNLQADTTILSIGSGTILVDLAATGNSAGDTIHATPVLTVTLTIPTLRVTTKESVEVVVYRTPAGQTLFYRVGQVANTKTADTVSFVDTLSDFSLLHNEQLYTNGGEVENIAVPATGIITQYQNRLMAIPAENRFQVMYSKQTGRSNGSSLLNPVAFAAIEFFFNYDQRGGEGTALSPLDDKLVISKDNNLFVMQGQGPAPNGSNNDFSTPQLITTDCGVIDTSSLVIMPLGLMFKSNKGIYLLDRSLVPKYIGADVEAYNAISITSAQLIADTNQVRFSLDDQKTVLVYDYFTNNWSWFVTLNVTDSVIVNNTYTYLDSNLEALYQENPEIYTDDGKTYSLKIVTSWLSLAGFQGFQRIYRFLVSGNYYSPHQLKVGIAYDFNSNITQQELVNTQEFTQYAYGSDYTYGATSPMGGVSPQTYQFRIANNRQKCEAIQLTFEEVPLPTYGQSLSLSAVALEVGMKKGLFKLPASRTV